MQYQSPYSSTMSPRWTLLLVCVTLLLLARPSDSYFFFGFDLITSLVNTNALQIFNPLNNWFLGGGTSLVYNALTFNFLGIKDKIRGIFETLFSYGFIDGLNLISTVLTNVIAAVAAAVAEILTIIVSNIIETGYRKKIAFAEFLFRVATGRSLEGVVEFARALREMDEDPEEGKFDNTETR